MDRQPRSLSRGFITDELRKFEDLKADNIRRNLPRFHGENFQKNVDIVDKLNEIAKEKNCSIVQLAIAWTIVKDALPIPGTKHRKYLEENIAAADIELTSEDLAHIDAVSPKAFGGRYPGM
ncbi:aldo/keto reductase [Paenibacillus aceris]|uniref:Aryl-alcohol dehydrogenase-like predicted oxidoreductase n=1 Tax=Paenibacillus aceris TaxID=869555 RepID=A0ABS4I9V5_9BACL|nr:aldo/keto reductase [Paenibacillus aceris]MBP1966849.1 aryl-alcohol dehydrogenase-like predicted oxidoreductase [Paenibacillus aceris]NHW38921.1 aldo/keto reductase [Paenibacillus aceris]